MKYTNKSAKFTVVDRVSTFVNNFTIVGARLHQPFSIRVLWKTRLPPQVVGLLGCPPPLFDGSCIVPRPIQLEEASGMTRSLLL